MGLGGLEPPTSPLSGVRSNQLSYRPLLYNTIQIHLISNTCGYQNAKKETLFFIDEILSHLNFKEVIQPQVPLRLPCYDFTPVMNHTVVSGSPKVILPTSGTTHSHGVTGGVYKARERIHRDMLIRDY